MDGKHMKFQCKASGNYWENSKVVRTDMTAGNGVIHMVNKIQLPNSGIYFMSHKCITYQYIIPLKGLLGAVGMMHFLIIAHE